MATLNLDAQAIAAVIPDLEASANAGIVDLCNDLAGALKKVEDGNGNTEMGQKLITLCQKVSNGYNEDYLNGLKSVIEDLKNTEEIARYLSQQDSAIDVSVQDTSFSTKVSDPESVRM